MYQKLYKNTEYVNYSNHRIFLDSEEAIHMAKENFRADNFNQSTFESEIKSGDVVLDLGANIGMYTLNAARKVGKSGRVYSFEPDQKIFLNLKKNVLENGYDNVVLVNKAVSDNNGFENFATSSNQNVPLFGNHLIKGTINKNNETVETIMLDTFLENQRINFCKIDVEGSEYDVIKGMRKLIKENEKLKLLIEINPTALSRYNIDLASFLDCLYTLDFVIYLIDEEIKQKIVINKDWILEFAKKSKENEYVNILCVKNKKEN